MVNAVTLVEFELRPKQLPAQMDGEGKPISGRPLFEDVIWCKQTLPGGKTVLEREWDKIKQSERLESKLDQYFEAWEKNREDPVEGTRIELFPVLTPAQIKTLRSAGVKSIEELAEMTEEGIKAMGMGARAQVEEAKAYLANAQDSGVVAKQVAALKVELDDVRESIKDKDETISVQAKEIEIVRQENADLKQAAANNAAAALGPVEVKKAKKG